MVRRIARVVLELPETPVNFGLSNPSSEFCRADGQTVSVNSVDSIREDIGVEVGRHRCA